jgi:hypothetical protein
MGNMHAEDAANLVREGTASLRMAVGMNLTSNHYPPIPGEYVEPVMAAIEAFREDPDAVVDIEAVRATGMEPRLAFEQDGRLMVKAADLLEITHSWAFVADGDEEDE